MTEEYGSDFHATDDLDANLSEIEGPLTLLENSYRRLDTARGGLWYVSGYGMNIKTFLADAGLSNDTKADKIRDEILKDERAQDCIVTYTTPAPNALDFDINIVGLLGETYDLTLKLDGTNANIIINQSEG